MKPDKFMQTIYLGDRGCKAIMIDGWKEVIKIQITCISRVRSDAWNFYTAEDLEDGKLVFTDAKHIFIDPPGCIPNSYIDILSVEEIENSMFKFVFSVGASEAMGNTVLAKVTIIASQLHLEDSEGHVITQ